MDWLRKRFRKVHLDFHTPPFLEKVGTKFEAKEFIETLKKSNVNIVVVFAKDHYGLSYYDTKIGTKHPGLNFDLLKEILEQAHKKDIKVMAYHSVGWDNLVIHSNPGWMMVDAKGKRTSKNGDWERVCLNSPYIDELFLKQVKETAENYEIDGLWFDIVVFPEGACFCQYCLRAMEKESVDPNNFIEHERFNDRSIKRFMKRTTQLVKKINPNLVVTYNGIMKIGTRDYVDYLDTYEIESLPYQRGGYLYLPLYLRYVRTLGKPFNGVTSRFHKSWGDFGSLKNPIQLKYECATMLANGGMCSIGDQMHPQGKLSPAVYENISQAYAFVKEREEWCLNAKSLPYAAILADYEVGSKRGSASESLKGAAKTLMESHCHFDIIDQFEDFSKYRVVILPDNRDLLAETISALKKFVAEGGSLLATYRTSLKDNGEKGAKLVLDNLLGITYDGLSPYSLDYLRITNDELKTDIPEMDLVVYDRFLRIKRSEKAKELAQTVHPIIERTKKRFFSHSHAPSSLMPSYSAIVMNSYKKGKTIYFCFPIFKTYYDTNNPVYRQIVRNSLNILIPRKERMLVTDAPPSVEVALMKQKKRLIVHLVNYHTEKKGGGLEVIEDLPTRRNINMRVRETRKLKKVYLAPSKKKLKWTKEGNYLQVTVPQLGIHQMIVFES